MFLKTFIVRETDTLETLLSLSPNPQDSAVFVVGQSGSLFLNELRVSNGSTQVFRSDVEGTLPKDMTLLQFGEFCATAAAETVLRFADCGLVKLTGQNFIDLAKIVSPQAKKPDLAYIPDIPFDKIKTFCEKYGRPPLVYTSPISARESLETAALDYEARSGKPKIVLAFAEKIPFQVGVYTNSPPQNGFNVRYGARDVVLTRHKLRLPASGNTNTFLDLPAYVAEKFLSTAPANAVDVFLFMKEHKVLYQLPDGRVNVPAIKCLGELLAGHSSGTVSRSADWLILNVPAVSALRGKYVVGVLNPGTKTYEFPVGNYMTGGVKSLSRLSFGKTVAWRKEHER